MSVRRFAPVLLSGFILAAFPAHAQDADAVGQRLKTFFQTQGVELGYAAVEGDADEMTLSGATLKPEGEDETLPIGDITLNDVSEDAGAISIGTLSMDTFEQTREGVDVTVDGVTVSNLELPAADSTEFPSYENAEVAEIKVAKDGKQLFGLSNFAVELTPPEGDEPFAFTGSAESFTADLTQVTDPNARKVIDALGYQTLNGALSMAGSWNPADGRTVLSQYDVKFNEAGTVGLTLDIGGYTSEFQKALRDTQAKLAQSAGQDNSTAGMAMLGLMQQLTLHGASLRFEDDALTGKLLDYFAQQQGARAADVANQAKALLPFVLAQLNNPEFAQQITAAASKFLDDPKSLTITVKPAQPLPFAMVAAGAMTTPQQLPQQLGVTVTAND